MQASAKPTTTRKRRRAAKPPNKPVTSDDVRQWHADAMPKRRPERWEDLDPATVRSFVSTCKYERSAMEMKPLTDAIVTDVRKQNRTARNACISLAHALPLLVAEGVMDTKARNAVTTLVRVLSARLSELKRGDLPGLVALLRDLIWLKERLPPARPTRDRDHLRAVAKQVGVDRETVRNADQSDWKFHSGKTSHSRAG